MEKIYIEQTVKIQNEYAQAMKDLENAESRLVQYKVELESIASEMKALVGNKMTTDEKTRQLNDKLIKLQRYQIIIENKIRPILDKIEQLKIDAKNLLDAIRSTYPHLSDEQISETMASYLVDYKQT